MWYWDLDGIALNTWLPVGEGRGRGGADSVEAYEIFSPLIFAFFAMRVGGREGGGGGGRERFDLIFFIETMTVLGRDLVFQPVLLHKHTK